MVNEDFSKYCELVDRSCDALVLAYHTNPSIRTFSGRDFYIPSAHIVEESYGHALRSILGSTDQGNHWADAVKWNSIAHRELLEQRIREGTWNAIKSDWETQSAFAGYLNGMSNTFDGEWQYEIGDLFRFKEAKREKAQQEFETFWSPVEKARWNRIHEFMRDYARKEYSSKVR